MRNVFKVKKNQAEMS